MRGSPLHRERRSASYRVFSEICSSLSLSHLWRARLFRSGQEWRTPIPRPDLARFTPSGEARDGASVTSFGLLALVSAGQSRFVGLGWPHHKWPGVANFYFGCIWLHFVAFPIVTVGRAQGMRGSRLRGNDGGLCEDDVCEQCSNQRDNGAMGVCRWLGRAASRP